MDNAQRLLGLALVFAAVAWTTRLAMPFLFNVLMSEESRKRAGTLGQAGGNPIYWVMTPESLAFARWTLALLMGAFGGMVSASAGLFAMVSLAAVSAWLGYRLPYWWCTYRLRLRKEAFDAQILDLMIALINGLRAGMAVPQSLDFVAKEIGGPMQEELGVTLSEYRMGKDLAEALSRLLQRMQGEELGILVSSIILINQSGGSLAETLDRQIETVRKRIEFRQKLMALTEQGRFDALAIASAPFLTFGMMWLLDAETMRPMVTSPIGLVVLVVVLLLEFAGFWTIRKIMAVED